MSACDACHVAKARTQTRLAPRRPFGGAAPTRPRHAFPAARATFGPSDGLLAAVFGPRARYRGGRYARCQGGRRRVCRPFRRSAHAHATRTAVRFGPRQFAHESAGRRPVNARGRRLARAARPKLAARLCATLRCPPAGARRAFRPLNPSVKNRPLAFLAVLPRNAAARRHTYAAGRGGIPWFWESAGRSAGFAMDLLNRGRSTIVTRRGRTVHARAVWRPKPRTPAAREPGASAARPGAIQAGAPPRW